MSDKCPHHVRRNHTCPICARASEALAASSFTAPTGSARSGVEILESLKREGWEEDIMGVVMKSRDGRLIQVVWPNGHRIEAPNEKLTHGPNNQNV